MATQKSEIFQKPKSAHLLDGTPVKQIGRYVPNSNSTLWEKYSNAENYIINLDSEKNLGVSAYGRKGLVDKLMGGAGNQVNIYQTNDSKVVIEPVKENILFPNKGPGALDNKPVTPENQSIVQNFVNEVPESMVTVPHLSRQPEYSQKQGRPQKRL